MIAFLAGTVVDIEENKLILENNGVGFVINVPSVVTDRLVVGEKTKIYTYMSVKEDDISLYGFGTKDDLNVFRLLIGVNGIGPKAAVGVLSTLSADELRFAVLADDALTIAKTPGIGKKTAQKLILELKDKFTLEDAFQQKMLHKQGELCSESSSMSTDAAKEAVQALTALGYSAADSLRAVKKVEISDHITVEGILKTALKFL